MFPWTARVKSVINPFNKHREIEHGRLIMNVQRTPIKHFMNNKVNKYYRWCVYTAFLALILFVLKRNKTKIEETKLFDHEIKNFFSILFLYFSLSCFLNLSLSISPCLSLFLCLILLCLYVHDFNIYFLSFIISVLNHTVCPRSRDLFHTVTYCIKLVNTLDIQ